MDKAAPTSLQPGSLLAERYRIKSILGQGGMGTVYLAHLESLAKPVAIKEMRSYQGSDRRHRQAVEQFHREAQFLAHLDHPNLVHVSDYFEENAHYYLVMAYVEGQNLSQRLRQVGGPLPVVEVLNWAVQLTSVLTYLHEQEPPLLFRDLKPSNIMLDRAGRIRLIDFGIARSFQPDVTTESFLQGVGSAGYSPLEQYSGAGGTDPRSDLYSLGATLFHLLTHQIPVNPIDMVTQGVGPPSARAYNPLVPIALDNAITLMMGLRKEERIQTARQVQALLEQVLRNLDNQDITEDLTPGLPTAFLSENGRTYPLKEGEVIIGRQPPAQLVFSFPQISRQHVRLTRGERGYSVCDLQSRFGTFLNGKPLGEETLPIEDGDELVLGGVLSLRFSDPSQTRGGKKVGRLKGVWIDPDSQDCWMDGVHINPPLSAAQMTLLRLLESKTGAFFTREQVVQAVWPECSYEGVSEEAVDGLIKRLRARLREAGRDPIEVRRGQGLRLQS